MERFIEFMQHHPILFGILGVLAVAFFILESKRSGRKISPQALGGFVNREKAVIVDLRDAKEFREGHISGSRNIPLSSLKNHLDELREISQPIVMVCKMGQTSGSAVQQVGGENLYRLEGGILGWQGQGLPLVKPTGKK
ncbi:rhodanese-like domain-containing protein [Aquirhabdus parva]|uniref:Rhodanese-like domain-containing protein n=1 Tax=Aquirhabdus parva TaxID=2283318 RepID=A0A345P3J4_9GAMM|nr:rhodanese-like domain-containing protein [Aquirhabdus parva]AXI01853.1 rhodanese-like domain-containing protein [Aquirhabdus parva]